MLRRGVAALGAAAVTFASALPGALGAQTTHRLVAGPTTVAFGHYDPTKPGVLRIQSGDIVDVTTMLTSSPRRLQQMGSPRPRSSPS